MTPRLLDVKQAAAYCHVSAWTMRDWLLAGLIPTVVLPAVRPRAGEQPRATLRRRRVDRADLDAFIDARKSMDANPCM